MRILFVILCSLLAIVPVFALQTVETVSLGGAFTVTVPEFWTVEGKSGNGYFWETDNSNIRIRTYSPFDQDSYEVRSVDGLMEFLVKEAFETRDFDREKVEDISLGDYEGITYTYGQVSEGNRFSRTVFLYEMENGFIVAGYAWPLSGSDLFDGDVEALKSALETVTLQEKYTFFEDTQVNMIEGWQLTSDNNYGFGAGFTFENTDGVEFFLSIWPGYGAIAGIEEPSDFLSFIFNASFGDIERFDSSKVDSIKVAGFDAVLYPFTGDRLNDSGKFDRAVVAFTVPNNSTFSVFVTSESPDDSIDAIFDVLDTLQPGRRFVCSLFAASGIRIREESTTSSAVVRSTGDDETLIALRKATGSDGFIWFDVDEGWIRSDVIFHEQNACDDIPTRR